MVNYTDKINLLSEQTAIMRNYLAKQVTLGKMTHEAEQHKLDVMDAILGDYSRKKFVTLAGVLANDTWYRTFVGAEMDIGRMADKSEAAEYIRKCCGIVSRRDLAYKEEARHKFDAMRQRFSDWRKYKETENGRDTVRL